MDKIPFYNRHNHEGLSGTIAEEASLDDMGQPVRSMACHECPEGGEYHCVGWLVQQLGPGNNIALRLQMRHYENARDLTVIGPQWRTFEEMLNQQFEQDATL